MNNNTPSKNTRKVAQQVVVHQQTFVGTKDSGETSTTDIELVPPEADVIHPDVAERLKNEYGIDHPHKYNVYVADETDLPESTEQ